MNTPLGDVQARTFARATHATVDTYPPERRLTADRLATYLAERSFAVVGTARPDGRPHAAMSLFAVRRTEVWLPTVAGSVRERNLRAEPWMTLVVAEGDDDEHIVVILEGPAEVVDRDAVPADVQSELSRDWVSVWIRLRTQRVLSYAAEGART